MFHGNANSWFVFARSWKPRDAVCWLITVYPHQPTGGRIRPGRVYLNCFQAGSVFAWKFTGRSYSDWSNRSVR